MLDRARRPLVLLASVVMGLGTCGVLSACFNLDPVVEPSANPDPTTGGSSMRGQVATLSALSAPTTAEGEAIRLARGQVARALARQRGQGTTDEVQVPKRHTTPADALHHSRKRTGAGFHPPMKAGRELEWVPGQVIAGFRENIYDKQTLQSALQDMAKEAKLDPDITLTATSCTARRMCLVKLKDAQGKPLDKETTTVVAKALHDVMPFGIYTVCRNFLKHGFRVPNDPFFIFQWHYEAANIPLAWDITLGDPNIIVADLDSGLRANHPDMQGRVVQGADLIDDPASAGDGNGRDSDPTDPGDQALGNGKSSWHGTHTAGTIAAETDNGEGVAGVVWNGRVQPVRVLGMGSVGSDFDIISGAFWAFGDTVEGVPINAHPARVINMSLGGVVDQDARDLWEQGFGAIMGDAAEQLGYPILVAAAGNDDRDTVGVVPADLPGMITVGATRFDGTRAPYSNRGNPVDIMAPGGQTDIDQNLDSFPDGVLSLYDNEYEFEQGTSMAAPHVTGAAALALAVDPNLHQADILALLRSTANPAGQCNEGCGAGHLDVAALLLGAGGIVTEAARLATDSFRLAFGPGVSQKTTNAINLGGRPLPFSVSIVGAQGSLFSVSPSSGTLEPGGRMLLTVTLDRQNFSQGSANLVIDGLDDAADLRVNVDLSFASIQVSPATDLQNVQVVAFRDLGNGQLQSAGSAIASATDDFKWQIDGLEAGDYFVYATGDDNNDGIYDPQSESFGAWPNTNNPAPITVEEGEIYTVIDFTMSGGFVVVKDGKIGSACATDSDCTFADDAACIIDSLWPGGYCSRVCDDGFCGPGGACEPLECDGGQCFLCLTTCVSDGQCRPSEGYSCDFAGTCTPVGF